MELKPCRRCGVTPYIFSVYYKRFRKIRERYSLTCPVCGNAVCAKTKMAVKEAWNRRVGEGEKE